MELKILKKFYERKISELISQLTKGNWWRRKCWLK